MSLLNLFGFKKVRSRNEVIAHCPSGVRSTPHRPAGVGTRTHATDTGSSH